MLHNATDGQLFIAWVAGDEQAFVLLYQRYKDSLYRYLLRHLETSVATELFQEVWARLVKNRHQFDSGQSFKPWLFAIAHHLVIDTFRRSQSQLSWTEENPSQSGEIQSSLSPEELLALKYQRKCVESAIATLPVHQRNAFLLRYEGEFSLQEIADITGEAKETVKSRLRYANNKLRHLVRRCQ